MTDKHGELINTPDYTGAERRRYAKTLEQLEIDVKKMLEDHEAAQRKWRDDLRADLLAAFPDGDVDGHCQYHLNKIRAAKAEEEFWKAAKEEAIKNGVSGLFAVLKAVSILAILGAAYKLGFGPAIAKVIG